MFCSIRFKNWKTNLSRYWTDADVCKFYDRKIKTKDENPTIGIILCKEENKTVIEFTLPENNKTIFAKEYKAILPSKEEFKKQIR